jgi:hypothetical protein
MAEAVTAVGTAVLVFVAFGQLVMFYWQLPQNVEADRPADSLSIGEQAARSVGT